MSNPMKAKLNKRAPSFIQLLDNIVSSGMSRDDLILYLLKLPTRQTPTGASRNGKMPRSHLGDDEMPSGILKYWNDEKGYGFIRPDSGDGKDIFVHVRQVE